MKKIIFAIIFMCFIFTACSENKSAQAPDLSVITDTEVTEIISEKPVISETNLIQENIPENTENAAEITEDYIAEAARLMGALDYIDQIGGGNIPKDESDIVEIDGRQYAKVSAQFENTTDLKEYMEENLSDSLIQSRYSHILGSEEPYYIDVDGALYGYVTAKGSGFPWITEDGEPVISISEINEDSFTAVTKFDNFGGECEMELYIIFSDGFWKINSISYDGVVF